MRRFALVVLAALPLAAQTATTTPAPNPDAPSFRVGAVIYGDYTYQEEPRVTDANGDRVNFSQFNVSRAYINLTGNLNRRIQYRITPDITRETGSSSLNGSYTFRLKYAFAQLNLDEWSTKGTYVRFGLQQTPYIDFMETAYRYRFQGPIFVDREGFMFASDFGFSGRYFFPNDYGDVHVGFYNGEGFARAETSDQKAVQARVSLKPLVHSAVGKGWTIGAFYDGDNYVASAERRRFVPYTVFEAGWGKAGLEGLRARDQTRRAATSIPAEGFSIWATPKLVNGFEILARHDNLKPNRRLSGEKKRDILGLAYWIPNLQRVTSSVMIDGEHVRYDGISQPDETRYAVHMQVIF